MLAAMQAIPALTGTDGTGFNFSIFTGDLTAHDPDNQYSRFVPPLTPRIRTSVTLSL